MSGQEHIEEPSDVWRSTLEPFDTPSKDSPMLKPNYYLFAILALLVAGSSCRNNSTPFKQENTVAKIDTTLAVIPDPQDLLEILRGNWQSESNPADQIFISDSLLTHVYNGQAQQKNIIEIDATCAALSCAVGDQPEDGWCIVEKTPAGDQCLLVLKCDKKTLQIRSLSGAKSELVFKKL